VEKNVTSLVQSMLRQMGTNEAQHVYDIASHLPLLYTFAQHWSFGHVVELGVGYGFSTTALLAGVTGAGQKLVSYDSDPQTESIALKEFGIQVDNWAFRLKDSVAAAADFEDKTVSLWFLDTLHTYDKTKEELETWLPKMHPYGVMCGHDYFLYRHENLFLASQAGVHIAVDEFAKKYADRFRLQIFPHDRGLFVFWPK